jgi:carboxyl-terminal processing protease
MLHTLDPHSTFMSPEAYKEMNLSTSGAFGGLGIVISIRDQMLTVINPMPDTPAGRAGLKRFDRIVKINNESTLNMPLDDAVRRLRGEPGTPVTVWSRAQRDGLGQAFALTRGSSRSVGRARRSTGIGTSGSRFQQPVNELESLADSREGPIKGPSLSARQPGGLLGERRACGVLTDGVIVPPGASRAARRSAQGGDEPPYPLVVLSAATRERERDRRRRLKGDRALIVGRQTFGRAARSSSPTSRPKGGAQVTIAQYHARRRLDPGR